MATPSCQLWCIFCTDLAQPAPSALPVCPWCWVWLTYSAIYSRLPFNTNISSKLIVTALFARFKKVIPHYWTEGVSIQSYCSTATVISTELGKKNKNLMPIHFYWNWIFEINSNGSIFLASNFQIFMTVWFHINLNISTVVKYLWLLLSLCSLSYYSSSFCQEGLESCVWAIPSSFYFGHKLFKASVWPKHFNYIISYPTIRLDWSPSLLPGSFTVLRVVMRPKQLWHHHLSKVSFRALSWYPTVTRLHARDLNNHLFQVTLPTVWAKKRALIL